MKEAFDKIRKRSREELTLYEKAIQIVSEVEAEYNKKFEPAVDCIEYSVDGFNLYLKEQYRKGYEDAKAEYGNGWIPCSDRLPEDFQSVLCYAESIARSTDTIFVGSQKHGCWFLQSSIGTESFPTQYKVVAWMPLTSPYTHTTY